MQVISTTETHSVVLNYLKKEQLYNPAESEVVIYFGVNMRDIIKYIERPDACGNWPFDFVCEVEAVVQKIARKFIVAFPAIEEQTEEDRVLGKMLAKRSCLAFGTNTRFRQRISAVHIAQYMMRDKVIYDWNPYFVMQVQQEVKKAKSFLL